MNLKKLKERGWLTFEFPFDAVNSYKLIALNKRVKFIGNDPQTTMHIVTCVKK